MGWRYFGRALLPASAILVGCSDSPISPPETTTPSYPPPPPGVPPRLMGQMGVPQDPIQRLGRCEDVAIDSSGDLYVLEEGRITVMNPQGVVLRQWAPPSGAGKIVMSSFGHPYLLVYPHSIQRESPEGSLEKE